MTAAATPTPTFFPHRVEEVRPWADDNAVPFDEARRRFLQAATVRAVAADLRLADRLVLQGAAALRLFCGLPRRSKDLDFITRAPEPIGGPQPPSASLDAQVKAAVHRGLRPRARGLAPAPAGFPDSVKVDVFLKPDPTESCLVQIPDPQAGGGVASVRVAVVEQLLASKLHAIVSAAWRPRRDRSRDVWDVTWVASNLTFEPASVARALRLALEEEGHPLAWDHMLPGDLKGRTQKRYDRSVPPSTWGADWKPFPAAWRELEELVLHIGRHAH